MTTTFQFPKQSSLSGYTQSEAVTEAERLAANFAVKVDAWEAKLKTDAEAFRASVKGVNSGQSLDSLVKGKTTKIRSDLAVETRDQRAAMIGKLEALLEQSDIYQRTLPDVVVFLSDRVVANSRTAYIAHLDRLRYATRAELEAAAVASVAKGDAALGAAVAATVGNLQEDARPFDADDLATAILGPEWQAHLAEVQRIANAVADAKLTDLGFVNGFVPAEDLIAHALTRQGQQGPEGLPDME